MRNGFKVFDADAHVVEPKNIWERFLDPGYQHRVSWQQPFPGMDRFRPATVDGRYTQSHKTLYGRQQEAVRWTTEAMREKYGEVVDKGFDGASVAESMKVEGVDLMVLYGPGYDMWIDGIDPDLQAGMARAYNRWAEEMRETSGGRVLAAGPVPLNDVTRAIAEVRYAHEQLGTRCFWSRPNPFNHRTLGDRYFDPLWEVLQDLEGRCRKANEVSLANEQFQKEIESLKAANAGLEERLAARPQKPAPPDSPSSIDQEAATAPLTAEVLEESSEGDETAYMPVSGYMDFHVNNDGLNPTQFDFHRFVLMFWHVFSDRIRFWSEIELEHALVEGGEPTGELELEQAYLDFLINPRFNFRAGMLLTPMGIINERHEPPSFHGVERPFTDTVIIPTTWFGSGAGVTGDLGKGFPLRKVGEAGQVRLCPGRIFVRLFQRIGQNLVRLHHGDHLQYVIVLDGLLGQNVQQGLAFPRFGHLQQAAQRQGHLAFLEIDPHWFADLFALFHIIQGVIDDLKSDSQIVSVVIKGFLFGLGSAGQGGADFRRRREKAGGFVDDDGQVIVLGSRFVTADQLQDFPLGHLRGGLGDGVQHAMIAQQGQGAEGSRQQIIPHQHAGRVPPHLAGRALGAPRIGLVHNVVVKQGGGMQIFQGSRSGENSIGRVAEHAGGKNQNRRAQPLAS